MRKLIDAFVLVFVLPGIIFVLQPGGVQGVTSARLAHLLFGNRLMLAMVAVSAAYGAILPWHRWVQRRTHNRKVS